MPPLPKAGTHTQFGQNANAAAVEAGGKSPLRKLFSADGRIGRGDYWLILIAQLVALVLLALLFAYLDGPSENPRNLSQARQGTGGNDDPSQVVLIIGWGFVIVTFIALAVMGWATEIKRFHDLNWSGWLTLLTLIPIVGLVYLVITLFVPGNPGPNKYGLPHSGTPFPSLHSQVSTREQSSYEFKPSGHQSRWGD
jgi:uncharacterized membrane protein YhaH (DUF805 family)